MSPSLPASGDQRFSEAQREGVYRAIRERRDVRSRFTGGSIDSEVLWRLLEAAHSGPSVGFMQPWRFLLIRSPELRQAIRSLVEEERLRTAKALGKRSEEFLRLKVEGITECAEVMVVSMPPERERYVFGRRTLPDLDLASVGCALENLWLAARAEGLGLGWVSIFDPEALAALIRAPEGAQPVAVLCLGPVSQFDTEPELERRGWDRRRSLQKIVDEDEWGRLLSSVDDGSG